MCLPFQKHAKLYKALAAGAMLAHRVGMTTRIGIFAFIGFILGLVGGAQVAAPGPGVLIGMIGGALLGLALDLTRR